MQSIILMPLFWGLLLLLAMVAMSFLLGLVKQSNLKQKLTVTGIALSFIISAFCLYQQWGASPLLIEQTALNHIAVELDKMSKQSNMSQADFLVALKKMTQQYHYSHAANARLGNIYIELGFFAEATQALTQAVTLAPQNQEYWVQWIYSHSLYHQGKLPEHVKNKALELVSEPICEKTVLNLLAIDDYFQGNYQPAYDKWQRLLATDETLTAERRLVLENAVQAAKRHLTFAEQ